MYLPSDGDAVYEDEVQALVASLYDGINSTVFAYGELATLTVLAVLACSLVLRHCSSWSIGQSAARIGHATLAEHADA